MINEEELKKMATRAHSIVAVRKSSYHYWLGYEDAIRDVLERHRLYDESYLDPEEADADLLKELEEWTQR